MNDNNHTSSPSGYPLWFHLVTPLLLLVGLSVFLLFGFFAFVTLLNQPAWIGAWNLFVTAAEGWALFLTARHYFSGTQTISTTLLWAAVAALGVPLIASGGCAFMADSFRIAG